MAVTPALMLTNHPEFEGASNALLQDAIDKATRRVNPDMFKDTTDDAIEFLACHIVALSPYGQAARLVAADRSTTYLTQYEELAREAATGYRVI